MPIVAEPAHRRISSIGTTDQLRRNNLSNILGLLHRSGPLSRAELTRMTGLNRSTVGTVVADLAELRMVYEQMPEKGTKAGRPSPVVHIDRRTVAIAVNPEVDAVHVGLVGLGGRVRPVQRGRRRPLGSRQLRQCDGRCARRGWVGRPSCLSRASARKPFAARRGRRPPCRPSNGSIRSSASVLHAIAVHCGAGGRGCWRDCCAAAGRWCRWRRCDDARARRRSACQDPNVFGERQDLVPAGPGPLSLDKFCSTTNHIKAQVENRAASTTLPSPSTTFASSTALPIALWVYVKLSSAGPVN